VDREFRVREGREPEFERVFGPDGLWRKFLVGTEGYFRSEVRCEFAVERTYRVLDIWTSHVEFEQFRRRWAAEYERFRLSISADELIERELLLGMYYEAEEGDDLVPTQ